MKPPIFSDPLPLLLQRATEQIAAIQRIEFGDRYCAVMLENGQSGVCATLGIKAPEYVLNDFTPETMTPGGRIIAQAFVNAVLNGQSTVSHHTDIANDIIESGKKSMVMVGYFDPMLGPLRAAGIEVIVFDPARDPSLVSPQHDLGRTLKSCPFVMVTATAITNGTFSGLLNATTPGTEIWLAGPSTPLTPFIFESTPVSRLYGSLFPSGCHQLLDRIREGAGTRNFLQLGKKVVVTV